LNETEALRAGRWQAFLVKPIIARLLELWDAAPTEERTALMRQAAQHIADYLAHPPNRRSEIDWGEDDLERPVWIDKSVLAHAHLLAEQFEAAHQLAVSENVLGWSSSQNPQGWVAPFFLVLLSGQSLEALPRNLGQLWKQRLSASTGFWFSLGGQEAEIVRRLEQAYVAQLAKASLSDDSQEKLLAWCVEVTHKRVEAIVGGQRRKSYDKAANLTAACAETLRLRGNREAANALVNDIRNRFPRHRAFQAELQAVL
jgi:hypothetical protein